MLGQSEKLFDCDGGVQILLNRMDSHPEEFLSTHLVNRTDTLGSGGRWDWVFNRILNRKSKRASGDKTADLILPFLTDGEIDALYDRYVQLNRDCFKQAVMEELLAGEEHTRGVGQERFRIGDTGLAVVTRDR